MYHKITGEGSPVVFLHGWGGSSESFEGLANRVDCKRCLVDFYGFGKTPHPDYPLKLDDYADGVRELLSAHNFKDATLVGHSFGGRVALKLASDERVGRLVIIDGAGVRPRRKPDYYFKVGLYKLKKRFKLDTSGCGSKDYRALSGAMRATFSNVVNENLTLILKTVKKPTLLIWGGADCETPLYMAKIMRRKIEDSGLIVYRNAGHFSYLEQPARTAAIIGAFIKEERK